MSITPQQVKLVQESFAKVVPIADQAAEIFYATLFDIDPSLKPMFKGNMKEQGKKLMTSLSMVVKSLSNLTPILPAVQKLAKKHVDYGVKKEHYTIVGNALLVTLQKGLNGDFTPEVRAAWIEAYKILADAMKSAAYPK